MCPEKKKPGCIYLLQVGSQTPRTGSNLKVQGWEDGSVNQAGLSPILRTVNVKRPRLVGHAYNRTAGDTEMASLRGLAGSLAHTVSSRPR